MTLPLHSACLSGNFLDSRETGGKMHTMNALNALFTCIGRVGPCRASARLSCSLQFSRSQGRVSYRCISDRSSELGGCGVTSQ